MYWIRTGVEDDGWVKVMVKELGGEEDTSSVKGEDGPDMERRRDFIASKPPAMGTRSGATGRRLLVIVVDGMCEERAAGGA